MMKKLFVMILAAMMIFSAASCGKKEEATGTQMPNPFVGYDTIEEAEKAAGFDITVPDTVDGYKEKEIQVMNGEMIQITFINGEDRLTIRKAAGSDDISGDYNTYEEEQSVKIGENEVTMKGNDGTVQLAIWNGSGYTYAVTGDKAMTAEDMTSLVAAIF